MNDMIYDLIIIGGGPGGMTAAIYASRGGLDNILLIEREACGGKMNMTEEISNYPGYESIAGLDLSEAMLKSVNNLGVIIEYDNVIDSNFKNDVKYIYTKSKEYSCYSVIIANGLKNKKLGIKGEEEFRGRGVSYCATCDGYFFKNKTVAIVGGGNTALEDAIYLSKICKKIFIFVRKNEFRAESFLVDEINKITNIEVLFKTQIIEILGEKFVTELLIKEKETTKKIAADGVFLAIGYIPDNEAFSQIETTNDGFFKAPSSGKTNIPGVFVCGDCREKNVRQIVTATSDGACVSEEVLKYLRKSTSKKILSQTKYSK